MEVKAAAAEQIAIEREARMKAEIRADALREVQQAVNAVQGGFYERLEDLTYQVRSLAPRTGQPLSSPGQASGDASDGDS